MVRRVQTARETVMDKAGGIIALIAGVLGIVAGFFTLFVGGIGSAFEAKEADSILNLAWVGIAAAMLVVIGGGVSLAKPRSGGMAVVFASVVGIVYGGSLVAICLALALIGGSIAVLAPPKTGELDETEPARKRWQALAMSLGAGVIVVVIATVIEQNGNTAGSAANPQTNAAQAAMPTMTMDPTASENRSSVMPAQPASSAPAGPQTYRLGGSTLEFVHQPDGALSFKLLIVSDDGNTGEAEGLLRPSEGVAVWKNEEFECELRFRWQGNAVKLEQKGMCGFGMGVDGSGVYVR
jgi:hypothetical protein